MSAVREFQVGETMTYPMDDYRFFMVCVVPEDVALAWVAEAAPETTLGCRATAADIQASRSNQWLNKLAVVVSNERRRTVALYLHDGEYWLIQQRQP